MCVYTCHRPKTVPRYNNNTPMEKTPTTTKSAQCINNTKKGSAPCFVICNKLQYT